MNTIQSPHDGVLLVRCASDETLRRAGCRNGLVTRIPMDGAVEGWDVPEWGEA